VPKPIKNTHNQQQQFKKNEHFVLSLLHDSSSRKNLKKVKRKKTAKTSHNLKEKKKHKSYKKSII